MEPYKNIFINNNYICPSFIEGLSLDGNPLTEEAFSSIITSIYNEVYKYGKVSDYDTCFNSVVETIKDLYPTLTGMEGNVVFNMTICNIANAVNNHIKNINRNFHYEEAKKISDYLCEIIFKMLQDGHKITDITNVIYNNLDLVKSNNQENSHSNVIKHRQKLEERENRADELECKVARKINDARFFGKDEC